MPEVRDLALHPDRAERGLQNLPDPGREGGNGEDLPGGRGRAKRLPTGSEGSCMYAGQTTQNTPVTMEPGGAMS